MIKITSILVILILLSSGCISKDNKSGDIINNSNKDEYSTDDGTLEEDDSGIVQTEYNNLDLSNKNLKMPDGSNVTRENVASKTTGNIPTKTSV